jgi:hypothetical protein
MKRRRITEEEAKAQGFTIDSTTYPHFGYKGPRFDPTDYVYVFTPLEEELMALLEEAAEARRNSHNLAIWYTKVRGLLKYAREGHE